MVLSNVSPRKYLDASNQVSATVRASGLWALMAARQPALRVALGAVVEHRTGGFHLGCGVGQVVGQHLVYVGPAGGGEVADPLAHDPTGKFDDVGGGSQIGGGEFGAHVAEVTER